MKNGMQILLIGVVMVVVPQLRAADLTVEITGVRSNQGAIRVSLFADADSHLKNGRGVTIAARAGTVGAVFSDVAPGTYSVAAYHDEDEDGELTTNFLGMPVEGFGFSNNATARFGPPRYEASAFRVDADPAVHGITLIY